MPADVLVIGYGNSLRGDDGIGPAVGEGVAALGLSGTRVIIVHQLTPELAADLAGARLAVFVDAAHGGEPLRAARIEAATTSAAMSHTADPHGLLALCSAVYQKCPETWLVSAAGSDFDFRDGLSSTGRENAQKAIDYIEYLIGRKEKWTP
jgi:hydrogenase maturation protease